jgi:hypothetical protein
MAQTRMQDGAEMLRGDDLAERQPQAPALLGSYAPQVLTAGRLRIHQVVLHDDQAMFRHRWRLIEVLTGTLTVTRTDGSRAVHRPGGVALIEPGTVESLHGASGTLVLHLLFHVQAEPCRAHAGGLETVEPSRRQPDAHATWGIALPPTLPEPLLAPARLLLRRACDACAGLVLRLHAQADLAAWLADLVGTVVHGRALDGLDRALHHLRSHLEQSLTSEHLAALAGLDERRFRELVVQRHGCQPAELLRRRGSCCAAANRASPRSPIAAASPMPPPSPAPSARTADCRRRSGRGRTFRQRRARAEPSRIVLRSSAGSCCWRRLASSAWPRRAAAGRRYRCPMVLASLARDSGRLSPMIARTTTEPVPCHEFLQRCGSARSPR